MALRRLEFEIAMEGNLNGWMDGMGKAFTL